MPWDLLSLSQHTEPWLKSDKIHERKRVVHSIFLLLKYVVDHVKLTVSCLTPRHPWKGSQVGGASREGRSRPPIPRTLPPLRWTLLPASPLILAVSIH